MSRTNYVRAAFVLLLVPLLVLSMGSLAFAALVDRGPIKATPPGQDFPAWYRDTAGTQLELNVGPVNSFFGPIEPGSPASLARGFGEEAFYWSADSTMTVPSGGQATLRLALEATARQNVPAVAYRVRILANAPVAGTYRITHPYGVETVNVNAGVGAISVNDVGATTGFDQVLARPVGPFLKSTSAPAGFLGNAVTATPVTGSPTGSNFFRIDGPAGSNLGGPGINFVQTNLFAVQGKVFGALTADTTPPVLTHSFKRVTSKGTFTITGTDVQSGFSHLAYHIDRSRAVTVPGGSATFTIKPGQHTVTFWGFDVAGNKSAEQTVTVQVKTTPKLSLPKITPASPRRMRTFTMSGKIGSADIGRTRVSFVIQRRVGNRWRAYKTVRTTLVTGRKTFSAKTKLARRGTFRVRTTHATDAMHVSGVSKWKTFRVR